MILAAGVGSRLKPLTDNVPKALLPFRGKPMLDHVILSLKKQGFHYVVINVHHHADMVIDHVRKNADFGISVAFSDERDRLMDTGGGMIRARKLLEGRGAFLVHNVDIYSDLDLRSLLRHHTASPALATLAVTGRETSRNFLVDGRGQLCGWKNNVTGEVIRVHESRGMHAVAFSGIHVVDPAVFELLDVGKPFSITKAYLELAAEYPVSTYDHSGDTWIDMAHPDHHPGVKG